MMSEWKDVAGVDEFAETDRKVIRVPGHEVCIFKREDGYFALGAWCSHDRAQLALGDLTDHEVMCPLHGARFDLRSGRNLSLPAVKPVPSYEVKVDGGRILLKVPL